MKKSLLKLLPFFLVAILTLSPIIINRGYAQSQPTERPMLYVVSYEPRPGVAISPWKTFTIQIDLANNGKLPANNIVLSFSGADFEPLDGGVWTQPFIKPTEEGKPPDVSRVDHAFRVSAEGSWKYTAPLTASLTYTDPDGNPYSQSFTFTIAIEQAGTTAATKTPTPSSDPRPLMVVKSFETDVNPLQPGTSFKLKLHVGNVGQANASNVSLIYGGGTLQTSEVQGTPQPGGVSGSGADTTNFSPLGSSNIVLLGDMPMAGTKETLQDFIVNVSTTPGTYPLKVSFVYTDPKGNRLSDDQSITLLVYALPQLEIGFYRDPGPLSAGQMSSLPIQVTNLARKSVVLGNITVKATDGNVENNTVLVGTLDPGGYFTLDANYTPATAGEHKLLYEIRYTDDFNQLRTFNAEETIKVEEGGPASSGEMPVLGPDGKPIIGPDGKPVMQPGIDPNTGMPTGDTGMNMSPEGPETEEGFLAKLWTSIKAFFGIGKGETPAPAGPEGPGPSDMPMPKDFGG